MTDGLIPGDMIGEVRGPADPKIRAACLRILKRVGLLEESGNDWIMHDYLDWSSSREQILSRRAHDKARKRIPSGLHADSERNPDGIQTASVGPARDLPSPPLPSPPNQSGEPATPAPRARKAARLAPVNCPWPAEFEPDETCRVIAQTAGIRLDSELSKARDWATAHGKRCKDWQAFFRNWLRKAADFAGRNGTAPATHGPEATALLEQAKAGKLGERAKRWADGGSERAIDVIREIAAERRKGSGQATLGELLPRQP